MAFVFYDTETTGSDTFYDQILQFAAIRTDDELNEVERFEIRCRIQPHILPAPGALIVTGVTLDQLSDPALPSHFEMAAAIHEKLAGMVACCVCRLQLPGIRRRSPSASLLPVSAAVLPDEYQWQQSPGRDAPGTRCPRVRTGGISTSPCGPMAVERSSSTAWRLRTDLLTPMHMTRWRMWKPRSSSPGWSGIVRAGCGTIS